MKQRIILWLVKKLLGSLSEEKKKFNDTLRTRIYNDAFLVDGLSDILRSYIQSEIKKIALTDSSDDLMWFHRGSIFAYQMLIQNMKRYRSKHLKEVESLKNSQSYGGKI